MFAKTHAVSATKMSILTLKFNKKKNLHNMEVSFVNYSFDIQFVQGHPYLKL